MVEMHCMIVHVRDLKRTKTNQMDMSRAEQRKFVKVVIFIALQASPIEEARGTHAIKKETFSSSTSAMYTYSFSLTNKRKIGIGCSLAHAST